MNETCSVCRLKYKMEPSFFYGAMYVSYALGVTLALALFVLAFFIIGLDIFWTFLALALGLLVLLPVLSRLSRNIWINFFVHYEGNVEAK